MLKETDLTKGRYHGQVYTVGNNVKDEKKNGQLMARKWQTDTL